MALSFEESKRLISKQAATPMMMSMNHEPGIMTLDNNDIEPIAAYEQWTIIDGYAWFDNYYDDKISYIDENKAIKVDESQVNISQEINSQFIPFEMVRYYDGIDLINMNLSIHYDRSDKTHGSSKPVNVQYCTDKIRFVWLVDGEATCVPGNLKFEVHADGVIIDNIGRTYGYRWKSKSTDRFNISKSLCSSDCEGTIVVSDDWVQDIVEDVTEKVAEKIVDAGISDQVSAAEAYATQAATYASEAASSAQNAVTNVLGEYATKTYVDDTVADIDVTEQLVNYALKSEVPTKVSELENDANYLTEHQDLSDYALKTDIPTNYLTEIPEEYITDEELNNKGYLTEHQSLEAYALKSDVPSIDGLATETYVQEEIEKIDVTEQLGDYALKTYVDEQIASVDVSGQLVDYAKSADVYTKTEIDTKTNELSTSINANNTNITSLSGTVGELQAAVNGIDTSPRLTYDVKYNDVEDENVGENVFAFYEITNEGKEDEVREIKQKFTIVGGSGGGASSALKISYVTTSPVIATVNDKILITYNFSGTDSSGDIVPEGNYTWKIGTKVIASGIATYGDNTFDATDFATTASQKFTLTITDDAGSLVTKSWTVQQVDVRLSSTFNDTYTYNGNISFNYTPYGAIQKDVHFILDGVELGVVTTSTSGIPTSYIIPKQEHGAHLLEAYITATINNIPVESNHIYKDIICIDDTSTTPIIGCATPNINVTQYNTVNIKYVVFDPRTETPEVTWSINGELVSKETLTSKDEHGYYTYSYKANNEGTFIFTITCGEAEQKTVTVKVEKLNIDIEQVTGGLEFDFNPIGYSNSSTDRLWSYNDVTMTVSDNFDWVNGGYQIDESGDQYFCVKAGTNAVINYNLFADDPKKSGKEFKVIFKTKNIRKRNTSFLTCIDDNIGIDMKVENATIYNSGGMLKSDYCEDTIIEYEFNINKDEDMMIAMSYEDGAPSKPCEYTETSSFKQASPKPITIGSEDCDVHIYRMKAYSNSLTDTDIKNNFIADARNADEMIARYNRNKVYNDDGKIISTAASGDFNVDALMKAAPDLRYIFLEVPQFTNDKDNKIDGCTVYFRYPAGTRPQDNWTCTGVRHRGQGTSSNLYGYAGRNIDLCMDRSSSEFTWTDEEGNIQKTKTITLTDTSVPTDYLNIKVNIASSENANNAQMARRFNEYQPFLRYARKKDSKVKDTMEFYNCVVFIRETSTDLSNTPHREFNDTDWHFYAIGNVGDSKKTDDTRVNNANDPKEHIIEITDADKPLSAFPTGKEGHAICPVEEWNEGNTAYDILHSTEYVYDEEGAFESFGGETYEFRYEMEDITEEQREANINSWRELYKFIVTSTDEEFYANLKNYFVVDSALYFYLFTERYTMVDNRAKNSFWHYGKVYISTSEAASLGETEASYYIIDDAAAAINNGYRYDLTFAYDMDTSLGIDNTGDYVFSYGKEDTDYYVDGDPTSDYVFRVADSVFFCRLRDLFPVEMQAMFKSREEKNAWDSTSLISQWDNSQAQFPEELWRLDYERKYYRTYLGLSIDNSINGGEDKSFLIGKFFGRKKYARRAFEINQEIYFATKYFGNKILSDVFWVRGNVPIGSDIKPNYSLTLVPYSDMYVCVQYTSTGTPMHKKVKAGETCRFESNAERMDFIYVYAASFIQEVGDLSRCYIGDNNFSSATRLQKLVIGSTDSGYDNTFMKEILVANNPLLEHLDLRNISGINTVINVSGCSNLKELYAEGTNATGVIFANGGLLQTAHLPKIASLSMKNLSYITDFVVDGYDNLQTLIVENTPNVNTYNIVVNAPRLKLVRLIKLKWDSTYNIENSSIFDRLLTIGGIDSSGYETDLAVITGYVHIALIKDMQLRDYQIAWPDLTIEHSAIGYQFIVTFVNADGTILDVQYIDQGSKPVDPIYRDNNPIAEPTKESTASTQYSFAGWDYDFTASGNSIYANTTIKAIYEESIRKYTVKYMSKGETLQTINDAPYGSIVEYNGELPVYTLEEAAPYNKYYLFEGWDQGGYVNGDKTINAVFDSCKYVDKYFEGKELCDMRPVELYMMTKLNASGAISMTNYIEAQDNITIQLGNDFTYSDIEEQVLIAEKTEFTGKNYIDTGINLLSEDRDFVLAIDCKMSSGNANGAVLAQCFSNFDTSGFKLSYDSGAKFTWGSESRNAFDVGKREVIVVRHKKGEYGAHIYVSKVSSIESSYIEFNGNHLMEHELPLVFGCNKAGNNYNNYAIGTIYWSKIWYADLGDDICKKLVSWPHDEIIFDVCCGVNEELKYYYIDINHTSSIVFIASNVLSHPVYMNSTSTNSGGWASSELNAYLNKRVYHAFPDKWKQLIKPVQVKSLKGDNSTEITTSICNVFIPSIEELGVDTGKASPHKSESIDPIQISHFTNDASRICYTNDGAATQYWTRSPSISSSGSNWPYFYIIQTGGNAHTVGTASSTGTYARIMIAM